MGGWVITFGWVGMGFWFRMSSRPVGHLGPKTQDGQDRRRKVIDIIVASALSMATTIRRPLRLHAAHRTGLWLHVVLACALARGVCAECWRRSDGVEICTSEPTGWMAVWWFWFAMLLFMGACLWSYEAWWSNDGKLDPEFANGYGYTTPLLDNEMASAKQEQQHHVPVKPVYRYLD